MNFPIGYGHEARLQQAAVDPESQETAADPPTRLTQATHGRKRARVAGGRFAADDPATAADEAWAES